jgi:cation diffusion facilitator family transporter
MNEARSTSKRRAAALSVGSNTFLVLSKLIVGITTGSVAIISEAIHSAMDLLAAIIAYVAVTFSDRPPDKDHPHGHGKIENLSGAVEALLIFGAMFFIAYEAIEKLIHGGQVKQIYLGAIVMGVSALINTAVSWHLQRVGKRYESEALLADAAHLRTDVYTSVGVLLGLLLVQFTRRQWLDPASALAVGLLIGWEAWQITRRSVGNLLDESLPEAEQKLVADILIKSGVTFHALRSRKSGSVRTLDLHLDVSPTATVEQVHTLCDRLEEEICQRFPGAQVLIHPEPDITLSEARTVQEWMEQILEQHQRLFLGYSDLHVHESPSGAHVSLRLSVRPDLSIGETQKIYEHLTQHMEQHFPDAKLYIQPVPQSTGLGGS